MGTVALHLIDRSRDDPFAPERQPRQLMTQLWYPAAARAKLQRAPYLEAGAARDWEQGSEFPAGSLTKLRAHARQVAPVADGGPYPVVVYSPGSASGRSFSTALIEELASRGYVVLAVDHTYDAAVVEFPGGKLVHAQPVELPKGADLRKLVTWDAVTEPYRAARVADTRFALDALRQLHDGTNPDAEHRTLPQNLAGSMDLTKVGMLGHSLGGATAVQAMLADKRIRAGCVLDSPVPKPVRAAGLDRPVLLMCSEQPETAPAVDKAWEQFHPRGWHRNLRLTGAGHNTFTDLTLFCGQLGKACPEQVRAMVGTINAATAVAAQRAYATAFFDQHLKGRHRDLLDHASPEYPQVKFLTRKPQ